MNKVIRLFAFFGFFFVAAPASAEVISVPAGGNLQAALDRALPGDIITLPAGSKFVGQFRFPAKTGAVTLTTAGALPDRRITPADASSLATIASGIAAMPLSLSGAKNWTLDGLRFEPNVDGHGEIIGIEGGENIALRRLLFVVPDNQQQKRFVLGNGRNITLTQSHCEGVWRTGQDSQCFVAWNGAGPYTITDNFLEAAGENIMFGGADSKSSADVPDDILVEGNYIRKRLAWRDDLRINGISRAVKNLFELKAARDAVIRKNVFEGSWADAQSGWGIMLTPRNQDNTAPWSVVETVLFEHNVVRDVAMGINIAGHDYTYPSLQTKHVIVRDNDITTEWISILAGNEIAKLDVYRNKLTVPADTPLLYLSLEGFIPTADGGRWPEYAVGALVWADNTAPNGYIHSPTTKGEAALEDYTQSYSLTAPDPTPPAAPEDLRILALETDLAAAKAALSVTTKKLEALLQHLASTQNTSKVQNLIIYLRSVPR